MHKIKCATKCEAFVHCGYNVRHFGIAKARPDILLAINGSAFVYNMLGI